MKRPLFVLAAVLILGVMISIKWKACTSGWMWRPSSLRFQLLSSESGSVSGELIGTVKSMKRDGDRIIADVRSAETGKLVRVYSLPENVQFGRGDCILASGQFFLFPEQTNPGQFDVRAYFDALSIEAGFSSNHVEILSDARMPVSDFLFRCSERLRENFILSCRTENRGILRALLLGEDDELSEADAVLFTDGGMYALVRQSGMQFVLLFGLIYRIIRRISGRAGISAGVSMCGIWAVYLITGGSVQMFRAAAVFSLRVLAPVLKRKFDLLSAAGAVFILMILQTPGVIETSGFWYTAASVYGAGILAPSITAVLEKPHPVLSGFLYPLSMSVCILPVSLFFDGSVQVFRPLLSALLMPFLPFVMFSGYLGMAVHGSAPMLSSVCFRFSDEMIALFRSLLNLMSQFPSGLLVRGHPGSLRIILYLFLIILVTAGFRIRFYWKRAHRKQKRRRADPRKYLLSIALLLALYSGGICFLHHEKPKKGETELLMLDVGQGDCFLVRSRNGAVLLDGGSGSESLVGKNVILPALRYYGIGKVSSVFLSHGDQDHVNGILELLESGQLHADRIYIPEGAEDDAEFRQIIELAEKGRETVRILKAGDRVQTGGCSFTVLWPLPGNETIGNDASLVLRMEASGHSVLFTGDISAETEERLLSLYEKSPDLLSADILKCPHHGSAYSSGQTFLQAVSPELTLLSYGQGNRYGHPAAETLKRLSECGSEISETARNGAVFLVLSSEGVVRTNREP